MRLEILDLAKRDLVDAFHFYEQQEEGLGILFLTNIYQDISSLKVFAGIHRKVHKKFFRALSKKFPFAIFYTIEHEVVYVRSVVDCRRQPSWIRQHII